MGIELLLFCPHTSLQYLHQPDCCHSLHVMASDGTAGLLELLVQNPNLLSKEDLEKLCEAISKETLDASEQETVQFQSSGRSLAKLSASVSSVSLPSMASNVPWPGNGHPSVFRSSQTLRDLAEYSAHGFKPITVHVPKPKAFCPTSHLAPSDGVHATKSEDLGGHSSHDVRATITVRGSTPIVFVKGSSTCPLEGNNTTRGCCNDACTEDNRVVTVKSTPGENSIMGTCMTAGPNFEWPYQGNYPVENEKGFYGLQRMQARYTVPCSEQAVATSNWLLENFEENALTSVPRSVMYQEYVKHFHHINRPKSFNQAVFGKMVRSCFPNLTTRRLGVRGHSRYHYAGLGVRQTSKYKKHFPVNGGNLNLTRAHNGHRSHRGRFGVAANVTIDGSGEEELTTPQTGKSVPIESTTPQRKYHKGAAKENVEDLSYPGNTEIKDIPDVDRNALNSFLNFYSAYNKQLLSYITALDLAKTKKHFYDFTVFLPLDCIAILSHPSVHDIIAVYEYVLYKKATSNLLPDCLAPLSTDFKVSVRKFAKTFLHWVKDFASVCEVPRAAIEVRYRAAVRWAEVVRRVTTLCHVAKEAKKALKDRAVTKQLLDDVASVNIIETAVLCAWCGCDEDLVGNYKVMHHRQLAQQEVESVKKYMAKFSDLLKSQAEMEEYIGTLEAIVESHAGLDTESAQNEATYGKARQFLAKWAMYTSKILTEITLRTSGSVGTFHLISLLFGDYIGHIIAVHMERATFLRTADRVLCQEAFLH